MQIDLVRVSKSNRTTLILGNDVLGSLGNIIYCGLYVKDNIWQAEWYNSTKDVYVSVPAVGLLMDIAKSQ